MKRLMYMTVVLVVLAALLVGCSSGKYRDGTYTGEAQGNNGPVKVSVTVKSGKITDVNVISHNETPGLSDAAIEKVTKAIVEKQTWEVDTVSGATNTSKAIKDAVKAALEGAVK